MKVRFLFFMVSCISLLPCFSEDPYWTAVIAGSASGNSVVRGDSIFVAGKDRSLNCITHDGSFCWRRTLTEKPGDFLSISAAGILYSVSEGGVIEAVSSQGFPLWQYASKHPPLFAPYPGKDGRVFLLQHHRLICLNARGKFLWDVNLLSPPVAQVAQAGNQSIIVILENSDFLRISIFGELKERKKLKKHIAAIEDSENGYVLALNDGRLIQYTIDEKGISKEANEFNIPAPCVALHNHENMLFCLLKTGEVCAFDVQTGQMEWSTVLACGAIETGGIKKMGNDWIITAPGFAALLGMDGKLHWQKHVAQTAYLPLVTRNSMIITSDDWLVQAYRGAVTLVRNKPVVFPTDDDHYGILRGFSQRSDVPFYAYFSSPADLFSEIEKNAAIGKKEPKYAQSLIGILENTQGASYAAKEFSSYEQARAAELLGLVGSYEYRIPLMEKTRRNPDALVAEGILRGFALLGYDPDGETTRAIQRLIRSVSTTNMQVLAAAADALESIIKQSDKPIAERAFKQLFSLTRPPYSNIIQDYARQKIKNIVQ